LNCSKSALGKKAVIDRQPLQPGDVPITFADISKARRNSATSAVKIRGGHQIVCGLVSEKPKLAAMEFNRNESTVRPLAEALEAWKNSRQARFRDGTALAFRGKSLHRKIRAPNWADFFSASRPGSRRRPRTRWKSRSTISLKPTRASFFTGLANTLRTVAFHFTLRFVVQSEMRQRRFSAPRRLGRFIFMPRPKRRN
jgi:hypothetical protein